MRWMPILRPKAMCSPVAAPSCGLARKYPGDVERQAGRKEQVVLVAGACQAICRNVLQSLSNDHSVLAECKQDPVFDGTRVAILSASFHFLIIVVVNAYVCESHSYEQRGASIDTVSIRGAARDRI